MWSLAARPRRPSTAALPPCPRPPAPDCPTLEQQANALGQRLLAEQAQQERAYDQRTRHGATQGALLTD